MNCSICQLEIKPDVTGYAEGNNAEPINDGRCCNNCNNLVVIPARLARAVRLYPPNSTMTDPEANK